MNARGCLVLFSIVLWLVLLRILLGCFFAVYQTEQVIITQFGKPVGDPITDPGLHFKMPIIQAINRIDKRFLEWDGQPVAIPTRDKTYIHVDTFARWRISDAKTFFVRLRDERSAQSRLEDILGSETRNAVAKNDLNEIQSTAYRQVQQIRGEADGKATEIYAKAYTQNPQAAEFYNFLKSMETYRKVLNKDATLVFSTDSDLFGLLKRASAKPQNLPPAR